MNLKIDMDSLNVNIFNKEHRRFCLVIHIFDTVPTNSPLAYPSKNQYPYAFTPIPVRRQGCISTDWLTQCQTISTGMGGRRTKSTVLAVLTVLVAVLPKLGSNFVHRRKIISKWMKLEYYEELILARETVGKKLVYVGLENRFWSRAKINLKLDEVSNWGDSIGIRRYCASFK